MTTPPQTENGDDAEKDATGTICGYRAKRSDRPCGAAQYEVHGHPECRNNHQEEPHPCTVKTQGERCGARRYRMRTDRRTIICTKGHRLQFVRRT